MAAFRTANRSVDATTITTLVRQFAGTDQSATFQDTTMSYDGDGRLPSKHVPEQNAGSATVYSYNNDDTIQSVTDARGASATYGYNNGHLVTGTTYAVPQGSNISTTPNVSVGYDAAGNSFFKGTSVS